MMLPEEPDVRPLLDEALCLFPENPRLHWLQGTELMIRRQYREAVPPFDRLIRRGIAKGYDRSISCDARIFDELACEAGCVRHFRGGDFWSIGRYFEIAREDNPHSREYAAKAQLCAVLETTRQ